MAIDEVYQDTGVTAAERLEPRPNTLPSHPLSHPPPGGPNPLTAARVSGGALKLIQRVRAEPGRQAVSDAF